MGRRKIQIQEIKDPRLRYTTFTKRRTGLIKKAAELSRLCQIKMLLMFEDLSGNVIKYSTHGNYEPNKYFESARSSYLFTFEDYPQFFAKDAKTADTSDKGSLHGMNQQQGDRYMAEEELSIEEEGDSDDSDGDLEDLNRDFKRNLKITQEKKETKTYKAKLRDTLKISIPKENNSRPDFPSSATDKNQNNSEFAKNLQALLMMQAQHANNLQIQPITFGESRDYGDKQSGTNSAMVSSTPTNQTMNQPIATPPNFNPLSTPTKNNGIIIPTTSNTVNVTPTNANLLERTPTNLKINFAQGFQQPMESQRMSFSQDEGTPRSQIRSRPPSLLNSSVHSVVDPLVPGSRRSSLSSLLDFLGHEDQLNDFLRGRSHTHSRVTSNYGTLLNKVEAVETKKPEDAMYSRKPTGQNFVNHQFFANPLQKGGVQYSLNLEELLPRRDDSKLSVEPNNASQFFSKSQITSRSEAKSESVDRYATKQSNKAGYNDEGGRSHSKDSHDRNNGTGSGMRLCSPLPLTSMAVLGRGDRSPLRNPNFDMGFNINSERGDRPERASVDSRKSGENSSMNLGWGVWNDSMYQGLPVRKDLDSTRGKLNISETSSIFRSPRAQKKVKP